MMQQEAKTMRCSIVGLGKLGASMAGAIASRGVHVVGVDVNPETVKAINEARAPVPETDLDATIKANKARLRATQDVADAIQDTDVTFVVVPTPSDERKAFSLEYATKAFETIGEALRTKDGYHLVVLSSTVLPGSTRYGLIPVLENASGKTCGDDFGVCYSPEFIALGSVIRDFLNPDFVLVGESDERSGDLLEALYGRIVANGAPVKRMSIENAELAKIAVNSYVTMKVTFANALADLCERIPGGDVDTVTQALGADRRIGGAYLKGALGYGGPCFPRDNQAFAFIADHLGGRSELVLDVDRLNRSWVTAAADRIQDEIEPGQTVGILGLAYKPGSPIVEESQGLHLARLLSDRGASVVAYDPLAGENASRELPDEVTVFSSAEECVAAADLLAVTTPDPAWATLEIPSRNGGAPPRTIIDFWRTWAGRFDGRTDIRYLAAGRSAADDENAATLQRLWGKGTNATPDETT